MSVRRVARFRLGIAFLAANLTLCAGVIPVLNPSFELGAGGTPLTNSLYSYDTTTQPYGWTITQGNLEVIQTGYAGNWVVQAGSYSVDMNGVGAGNTILTQTISGFTPGATCMLTFGLAANPSWCNSPSSACSLQVSIGGVTQDYANIWQSVMVFADQTFLFTPSASSTMLSFTDTTNGGGNGGPAIDNIRIADAPSGVSEPASTLLLLCGLGTLTALAKKRRQFV